jgi:diacylglycerol kinase (ATP)
MPLTEPLNLLFFINPHAGEDTNQDWKKNIINFFHATNHRISLCTLTGENDDALIRQKIKTEQPHRVIAVGGDGTITLVAKNIMNSNISMGILPGGSANGMAKELDIPLEPEKALNLLMEGEILKTDLIKVNEEICLHMSDIGLNAELVKYFEEGNRRGKWGYARVLLKVLWKKRMMYVTIETKDAIIKRKALVVIFANASKYGFGAVINPEGSLHDGLFEVVIVRRLAVSELLKMWLRPQPFNPKKIEIIKARSVEITTLHKAHFQVDGEYLGKINALKAVVLPGSLQLILPKKEN